MTNLEIILTAQHIAQIYGKQLEMAPEQASNLLNLAQKELFMEYAVGYMKGNGVEVNSKISSALAPFKTDRTFSSYNITTMFGITGYRLDVASDDFMYLSAFVSSDTTDYPDKVKKVDILTPAELGERLSNAITYPTEDYPVMVLSANAAGTSRYAFLTPRFGTLPNTHVLSLRYPTTPTLVLTITNGAVAQSTCTAIEFDAPFHNDIVRIILKYLGLSIGTDMVQKFVENQKINEV